MPLEVTQIQEKIKENRGNSQSSLSKATKQENRIRLHSEIALDRNECSAAITPFLDMVRSILPADVYYMFLLLFTYPVPTVILTSRIYTALHKIFDGRNPVFRYLFTSHDHAQDFEEYRSEKLKAFQKWKTEGFEKMKTAINSIVVVDLDQEQTTERPEPYFYFLDFDQVVAYEKDHESDVFEWIAFKQKDKKVAVFCDGYYRVFDTDDSGDLVMTDYIENEHDLGYCPARFFWTTPVNTKYREVKKSPLSMLLGKLDLFLFFDISNEHLNTYGRYPIYSGFASDCDYENDHSGHKCDDGFLRDRNDNYLMGHNKRLVECPKCSKKRLNGPGSFVEIDPPGEANDMADLRDPVKITTIDRGSLDYNNEDIANRAMEIYRAATGYNGMAINDKAVNEKQVKAIMQSLESALQEPQMNFEYAMTWTDETICLLRYGSESFQSASISLGTDHFIFTSSQILDLYQQAKESSFSISTLDALEDLYFETEFRNNPELLERQRMLNNLDPFRHLSNQEVTEMYNSANIQYEDYLVKVNFSSLIMRFEREQGSITEYALNSEFDFRIKDIQQSIRNYAAEMKREDQPVT